MSQVYPPPSPYPQQPQPGYPQQPQYPQPGYPQQQQQQPPYPPHPYPPQQQPQLPMPLPPLPATAVAVAEPPQPRYQPEPPKRQAAFLRVVKWPIRKTLKGIYLVGSAANRHRVVAMLLLALLVVFVGSGVVVYRATHPDTATGPAAITNQPDTPFTVTDGFKPPLPSAVIRALHAFKTYNAQELWDTFSPQLQQAMAQSGKTESAFQSSFDQARQQGLRFQQFIYSGGFDTGAGSGNFTVQAVLVEGSQSGITTFYFVVDTNGQIADFQTLRAVSGA